MKYTTCGICNNSSIALNETTRIDDIVYCNTCRENTFPNETSLYDKTIVKELDPTVCSSCNQDYGSLILNKIATYPTCETCVAKLNDRIFPKWVKGFFAGVIGIVIVGFFWNWKYFQAYSELNMSTDYFQKGNIAKATALISAASTKVPEVEDLRTLSAFYHGVELLTEDKSEAALAEFERCKEKLPQDFDISTFVVQARMGATFDRKDYQGFLEATKEYLAFDSTAARSLTSVASAYACIYADESKEEAKRNALLYLGKARAIDDTSKEMRDYYNMIEYRIDSKKIIRREEFIKQFPNGWTKNP